MRLSDFGGNPILASRAEVLAYRLLYGPDGLPSTQSPFGVSAGINGVGIYSEFKAPVLFVSTKLLTGGSIDEAKSISRLDDALRTIARDGEDWSDVLAWGIDDPIQEVASSDRVRGARQGTAGAPVRWNGPSGVKHGILTAGHVAGAANLIRDTRGNTVGNVVQCHLPQANGVDVALIELNAPSSSPRLAGPQGVTAQAAIDLRTTAGPVSGSIIAKAGWFYWAPYSATYLDLYLTHSAISTGGDSGSVALTSSTNNVIGTLIGSSSCSFIQDARTQLSSLSSFIGLTF